MKTTTKKLRSPLKMHGGKGYLARRFAALMPYRTTYVEPFAGGLNVLLNRPRATCEIVSDLNPSLVLFWRVMADDDRFPYLWERIATTKYEQFAFALAKRYVEDPPWPLDQIDRAEYAAMFLRWNRMSRGGLGESFAWSDRLRGKTQPGGAIPGDANAWRTMVAELPHVHQRVRYLNVLNQPAVEVIREFASTHTLIYADPPYVTSTRTSKDAYAFEMTDDDHHDLLSALKRAEERGAKIFLSGYDSDLYREHLPRDWHRHEFEMPNHSGQGRTKQRRVECLWESPSR